MREYLPFIVAGLTTGGVYALAAMGLVVTYTTSGVFNFAHGAIGMVAAFSCYWLRVDVGLPTPLAVAVAVLVVAPLLGVVIDRVLLQNLTNATSATYAVISLGLLVALQGVVILIFDAQTRQFDSLFPTDTYRLPGVNVGWDQTAVVVIAVMSAVGLGWFFRRTHLGLQTRAVVDSADLTRLVGTNPRGVTTFSWALGSSFAALSAILLAPFVGLNVAILTLLVVQAFGAAIVGRLTSLPGAFAGAMIVGIGSALSTKFVAQHPRLAGIPQSLPFLLLFAVLVFSRKGRFVDTLQEGRSFVAGFATNTTRQVAAGALMLPVLLILPFVLRSSRLLTMTATLAFVLVFASLGLLVGLARQLSLCHALFVALGATTLAHLLGAGLPYPLALLIAGLVNVPLGALIAIPAIRLSGLFLALATFGFGILAESLLFPTSLGFGASGSVSLARPGWAEGDISYYFLVLAVVIAGLAMVTVVASSRLGRLLRALADSPVAAESLGINPTATRVILFCLSSFLAAIAGGLLGSLYGSITSVTFDFFQSLMWLTVLVTAGASSLAGVALAAVLFVTVPAVFTSSAVAEYQPIFFGVCAILLAQSHNGLVGLVRLPDFSRLSAGAAWRMDSSPIAERVQT